MARSLIVEIFGNASQFTKELDKAAGKTRQVSKVAGVAGLALAGGLAFGLEKSVKAAMEGQVSQAALETALKATHQSLTAMTPALQAAEAASRKMGFTDDESRAALAKLEIATHSTKKSVSDLSVAQDIARFKHVSLTDATKALTMAMAGSQRATKQLGIDVPKVSSTYDALKATMGKTIDAHEKMRLATAKLTDKQLTANLVIGTVSQKLQGQAKAFSDTAAGGMERFHAQTQHLEETLGKALLPAIASVTGKLASMAGFLAAHTQLAKLLVAGLAALAGTLLAVSVATKVATAAQLIAKAATAAWTAAQWLLNAALTANPIGIVIVAVAALGAGLVIAYKKSETFREIVLATWHDVREAAVKVFDFLTVKIPAAFEEVLKWTRAHWPEIATLVSGPFAPLVALATNAFGVRSAFTGALAAMRNTAADVIGDVAGYFTRLPARIGAAILDGAKAIKSAVTDLFGKVIGWVKDVLGIGSPSAVFHEIGKNVVQGFANGLGSSAGLLEKAVVRIAESVLPSLGGNNMPLPGGVGRTGLPGGASDASGAAAMGRHMAAQRGWTGGQWDALNALFTRESGWNPHAENPSSHAYGIPQSLPWTKMPRAAWPERAGGHSDAAAQIGWGLDYIKGRYGNPANAWAHETKFGWYGKGGIFTQPSVIGVGERGPEAVIPLSRMGGGITIHNHIAGSVVSERELTATIRENLQKIERRTGSSVTAPASLGG